MNNRSFLREVIIKVLYQTYVYDNAKIAYDLDELIKEQLEIASDFVTMTIKEIKANQEELDSYANKYLKDWSIDRLSKVDKAIFSFNTKFAFSD